MLKWAKARFIYESKRIWRNIWYESGKEINKLYFEGKKGYFKTENKPQKTFDPRTKKKLILALCVAIGLIIGYAVYLIIDATVFITGASTPEDAVAGYLEASLLQDVDDMVRYSSEYNSLKLGDGVKRNDNELRQFLNNQYKNNRGITQHVHGCTYRTQGFSVINHLGSPQS